MLQIYLNLNCKDFKVTSNCLVRLSLVVILNLLVRLFKIFFFVMHHWLYKFTELVQYLFFKLSDFVKWFVMVELCVWNLESVNHELMSLYSSPIIMKIKTRHLEINHLAQASWPGNFSYLGKRTILPRCGNDENEFSLSQIFICGNDTIATVTIDQIPHLLAFSFITFLRFTSKYYCQYRTLFGHPLLFTCCCNRFSLQLLEFCLARNLCISNGPNLGRPV